jgi:hypothetical protein
MFSKPKVQKGIPRPKHLVGTTAETQQQPSHQEHRRKALMERGSEEGERRGKNWGSCAGNRVHTG